MIDDTAQRFEALREAVNDYASDRVRTSEALINAAYDAGFDETVSAWEWAEAALAAYDAQRATTLAPGQGGEAAR